MKTQDLMIGDWVCYSGDINHECPVKMDAVIVDGVCSNGDYIVYKFKPIPLTPEILIKNGFEKKEDDYG